MLIMIIPFMIAFAFLNRARGTRLYNLTNSTVSGRMVSMGCMALLTSLLFVGNALNFCLAFTGVFISLMLWCSFGWDNYWSAAIGNTTDITKKICAPVDWIMAKLPAMPLRLWGTIAMTLRMTFAMPAIIGVAFLSGNIDHVIYGAGSLLFGLPYFISGAIYPKNPIGMAEYCVGALLGAFILLAKFGV